MRHHGISSSTITCGWIKVYSFTWFAYHSTNTPVIGLGSHEGFVFQRFDPPMALSWLPINLGHEERELLDHCKLDTSRILSSSHLQLYVQRLPHWPFSNLTRTNSWVSWFDWFFQIVQRPPWLCYRRRWHSRRSTGMVCKQMFFGLKRALSAHWSHPAITLLRVLR